MAIVISGVNNNDKITAADGTIDLLSGVSYAGIITAPAFTTPGNLTAGHLNIGSNIQLGNAGIATATTFVGNLTGNVNATSNLLLQIGGSEKFRVASSGQLGIGGANYGTSGQVLTSGGSGSAATWSTVSGTTINNNADNRLITGSGTANTLNGESNLTWNGTKFGVGTSSPYTYGVATFNDSNGIVLEGSSQGRLLFRHTGGGTNLKMFDIQSSDGVMKFRTIADNGTTVTERISITSDGLIPGANNSYSLGTDAKRWANIHTNDLNLSNEGSTNDVDGTWGQYTIQEGENDLFLINKRSGKRYKFLLQEIN